MQAQGGRDDFSRAVVALLEVDDEQLALGAGRARRLGPGCPTEAVHRRLFRQPTVEGKLESREEHKVYRQ